MNESAAPFRWLGHSTVFLPGPPAVLVDPWRWRLREAAAELVLVTHGHADHCSEDDIAAAAHIAAPIVAPNDVAERLRRTFGDRVRRIAEGGVAEILGATVEALPARGPSRASGFHPAGAGLSYLVTCAEFRYLHLGDSEALDEHAGLSPDVAFFPVGGLVVTDPEEAALGAKRVGATLSVPVHWGDLNARFDAARRFVERCGELGVAAAAGTANAPRDRG